MAVIDYEKAATISPNLKKKAKLDRNSAKQILDETVIEIVTRNGYVKENRLSILNLLEGTTFLAIAVFAHFFIEKLPGKPNRLVLFLPYSLYWSRKLTRYFVEKDVFLFTYPLKGSRDTNGLALSSKVGRSSDLYTLTIASAYHKSPWAEATLKLTKSFTEWFASDGVLLEDLFQKDVVGLVNAYAIDHESKWDCFWRISLSIFFELFLVFGSLGLGIMIYNQTSFPFRRFC